MTVSVPDDIVLLIFSHLVGADGAEDAWPARRYDHRAAQAPFTLAAVCQHWRRLALTTSALWTYFGFPSADEMHERHLQRLELLRHRAGVAPIDVIFGWDYPENVAESCKRYNSRCVFEGILSLHLQWRTVVLHVSGCIHWGWTVDEAFQSSQWPLLESLSLSMNGFPWAVPAAPRLRRMWLEHRESSLDEPLISGGYPALTMLSVFFESMTMLRGLAPTFGNQLLELVLADDFDDDFLDGLESVPASFLALQCLTLDDVRWLPQINAPALKKLIISTRCIRYVEEGALRRFNHIRELQLFGAFNTSQLAFLEELSNITTLTFCFSQSMIVAIDRSRGFYVINTGVLRELAGREPPMWPHLQRLHFAPFDPDIIRNHRPLEAQDLIDFLLTRNTPIIDQGHGGPNIARIVDVVANYPGAPDWLEDRLRSIIAR